MLLYAILKTYALRPTLTDEGIYFYMANAYWDHGALPYRDYFFAHPPLSLFLLTLWIGALGFSLVTAKLFPMILFGVAAWFLHRTLRLTHGRLASLFGLALYLFNYDSLRSSSHETGMVESITFLLVGLWLLERRRWAWCGVALSLGALCGSYLMPFGGLVLLWVALRESRKETLRYLLGLAVPYVTVTLLCWITVGSQYFVMQFLYHLSKPEASGEATERLSQSLTASPTLATAALVGAILLVLGGLAAAVAEGSAAPARIGRRVGQGKPHRKMGLFFACGLALGFTILFNLSRIFPYYFLLVGWAMAGLGAFAAQESVGAVRALWREELVGAARTRTVVLAACLGLLSFVLINRRWGWTTSATEQSPVVEHQWEKSLYLPRAVDELVRAVYWVEAAPGLHIPNAISRYLWHEQEQYFRVLGTVANYLKQRTTAKDRLFGDSSSVPVIALTSGMRIIQDFADTNAMRFTSNTMPPRKAIAEIDRPELTYVVVRPRKGFIRVPEFSHWVETKFKLAARIRDDRHGMILIYRRR